MSEKRALRGAEVESGSGPPLAAAARWHSALRRSLGARRSLLGAAGWVSATFIAQQTLRLVSNVVLAWLLAPALLGTMLLISIVLTVLLNVILRLFR